MKKRLAIGIGVLALVASGFFGIRRLSGASQPTQRQQTATVTRGSLTATISAAGTVETTGSADLIFLTSGQVKEVKVAEGDEVKAGQVIATLDSTDADLQVAQAQASLSSAQIKLDQARQPSAPEDVAAAQAALASAQASLKELQAGPLPADVENARLKWEQAKDQLWSAQSQRDATMGNKMASSTSKTQAQASVASAEMAVAMAKLAYDQAQQGPTEKELAAAQAQVAQAQSNLAKLTNAPDPDDVRLAEIAVQTAELNLKQAQLTQSHTILVAPFDGTITSLTLQPGQTVSSGSAVGSIDGAGDLQVEVDISEVDVTKLKVGQEASITFDALADRTFAAQVVKVAAVGVSTQGVVNYPVTVRLTDKDPAIRPGMTANASIVVDKRENVLVVPNRAIRTQGRQRTVSVLYQGQVIEVPVEAGMSGNGNTEILGDTLKEGDVVLLNTSSTSGQTQRMGGGIGGSMGPVLRVAD